MRLRRDLLVLLVAVGLALPVAPAVARAPERPATFTNPVIDRNAADPFMTHHRGRYLLTHTVGDRLVIRAARSIADLPFVEPVVAWLPAAQGEPPERSNHLWAPELHRLTNPEDGQPHWYLYYSAGLPAADSVKQLHVLESEGDDPLGPYRYKAALGVGAGIDPTVHTSSVDGRTYLLWSAYGAAAPGQASTADVPAQSLWLGELASPWSVTQRRLQIAAPVHPWELAAGPVNEAPEVVERSGLLHVVYSASGCSSDAYSLGRLTVPASADLFDPLTWVAAKHPLPVFALSSRNGAYGVGHNAFFTSPDGSETWIVYHGHDRPGAPVTGGGGCGGIRTLRAQEITFDERGVPVFGEPLAVGEPQPVPSGDPGLSMRFRREPRSTIAPPTPNPPAGALDGVICEAVATPLAAGTCRFTTRNPPGALTQGFVSKTAGSFEVRNVDVGCRIVAPFTSQVTTGGGSLSSDPVSGTWVYQGSGAGIGALGFDDACTYQVTAFADAGGGAVLAGQTS